MTFCGELALVRSHSRNLSSHESLSPLRTVKRSTVLTYNRSLQIAHTSSARRGLLYLRSHRLKGPGGSPPAQFVRVAKKRCVDSQCCEPLEEECSFEVVFENLRRELLKRSVTVD